MRNTTTIIGKLVNVILHATYFMEVFCSKENISDTSTNLKFVYYILSLDSYGLNQFLWVCID